MSADLRFTIEQDLRLSQSALGRAARAWRERRADWTSAEGAALLKVTDNALTSRAYARVAEGFLRDCAAAGQLDPSQPVYLLVLGAGSGRLGYAFLRNVMDLLARSGEAPPVKLILTDPNEANRSFWQQHFRVTELVEAGLAVMAAVDILRPESFANPVIVAANHLFEGLPADAFWVDDAGILYESRITVRSADEFVDWARPDIAEHVRVDFERRRAAANYYADPVWNLLLEQLSAGQRDVAVYFPTGALACLDNLARLCGGRLLLLTSGWRDAQPPLGRPVGSDTRGNSDWVTPYLAARGGAAFVTRSADERLETGAFGLLAGSDLRGTGVAFREAVEASHPADFDALSWAGPESAAAYLARLRLSNYDGVAACRQVDSIIPQIGAASDGIREQLRLAIERTWAGYYPVGEAEDIPLALGKLRMALGEWESALEFLEASRTLHGESAGNAYYTARCHFERQELEAASQFLEKSLAAGLMNDASEQERYRALQAAIAQRLAERQTLDCEQVLDILAQVDRGGPFFAESAKLVNDRLAPKGYPARDNTADAPRKRLTIGMATYDDWDGVYFSVQAIRLFHPEVTERTEIVVIDNHPGSAASKAMADLAGWVKDYRYVPVSRPTGTAVRDLVFRHANADFVLCMDAHVMFAPGSLACLLDYLEAHPDSPDLLQGPMVSDDLRTLSTHWDPKWSGGMWGVWGTDERGVDPAAAPFEIPLHGLGVFACARKAWLGFNPRFRGFGGEEGYIHEKYRQRGAATLCLPFLRWIHRFGRPQGAPYQPRHLDGIRNLLIGLDELGLDPAPAIRHFEELVGVEPVQAMVESVRRELGGPFYFFEGIYCINLDGQAERWEQAMQQFRKLGIAEMVERIPAVETPHNHHIGCALSHRAVVAEAKRRGLRNVLVFEDDVFFAEDAEEILRRSLEELRGREWELLYLGGAVHGQTFEKARGCKYLEMARVTCTHAIAYSERVYARILEEVPDTPAEVALWCRKHVAIDQYYALAFDGSALITSPVMATQRNLVRYELRSFGEGA